MASRSRSKSFSSGEGSPRRKTSANGGDARRAAQNRFDSRSRSRSPSQSRSVSRSVSRDRDRRGGGGGGGGSGGARRDSRSPVARRRHEGNTENPAPSKCVGCFGLSLHTRERDIYDLFARYGDIEDVQLVYDNHTGRSRGFAFIYFKDLGDAKEAKEKLHDTEVDGRNIRCDFSVTKRAHTPTPGVYMGKPTRSGDSRGYRSNGGGGRYGGRSGGYDDSRGGGGYSSRRSRSRSHDRDYGRSHDRSYSSRGEDRSYGRRY